MSCTRPPAGLPAERPPAHRQRPRLRRGYRPPVPSLRDVRRWLVRPRAPLVGAAWPWWLGLRLGAGQPDRARNHAGLRALPGCDPRRAGVALVEYRDQLAGYLAALGGDCPDCLGGLHHAVVGDDREDGTLAYDASRCRRCDGSGWLRGSYGSAAVCTCGRVFSPPAGAAGCALVLCGFCVAHVSPTAMGGSSSNVGDGPGRASPVGGSSLFRFDGAGPGPLTRRRPSGVQSQERPPLGGRPRRAGRPTEGRSGPPAAQGDRSDHAPAWTEHERQRAADKVSGWHADAGTGHRTHRHRRVA